MFGRTIALVALLALATIWSGCTQEDSSSRRRRRRVGTKEPAAASEPVEQAAPAEPAPAEPAAATEEKQEEPSGFENREGLDGFDRETLVRFFKFQETWSKAKASFEQFNADRTLENWEKTRALLEETQTLGYELTEADSYPDGIDSILQEVTFDLQALRDAKPR